MGVGGASGVTEQVAEILEKFPGGIRLVDAIEYLVAWARANSLWPLVYGTACCAMEMMSAGSSRHDWARFGVEVARATPRQADLIILAGTVVEKMGPNLITLYEQMPAPKYVIAMGSCAISGGPFYYDSYSVVKGGDRLIPVDVYVPGCPPRPEALLYGIMELQEKIRKEGRRNPWKIGKAVKSPIVDPLAEARLEWEKVEKQKDEELRGEREKFREEHPYYKPEKPKALKREKFAPVPRKEAKLIGRETKLLYARILDNFPDIRLYEQPDVTSETIAGLGPDYILDLVTDVQTYRELILFLKEDIELDMRMLLQVTAVDWEDHFDVLVHLLSPEAGHKIFVRCPVSRENPVLETISDIFPGAEWHEREIFDLFGIGFAGHTDLRRIFLPAEFTGYPLRKDFEDPERVVRRPY